MTLVIKTRMVRSCGLETYQVLVNGTLLSTFMSKEAAEHKKHQLMHAWSVEKMGETK